jgi:EmrB/QacA subfamily drug resistance transporter
MLLGVLLMVAFVFHTFRPEHPLLDLRLFKNRNLTVSIITMFMFAAAFFGGLLLVPTYFQQVRGEDTFHAGLLVAPQGIGAMLTMPIAGRLSDRLPVGRIVPVGIVVIIIGMFGLTQVGADTPYGVLIAELFVMGLGMGATMMPVMTSALKTLTHHEVARGSTLLNITQQVASSVGVAIMSVILTNHLNDSPVIPGTEKVPGLDGGLTETAAGILSNTRPEVVAALKLPASLVAEGLDQAAQAFADTFWVAWAMVVLTLVPALMLPRKHEESHLEDDDAGATPASTLMH